MAVVRSPMSEKVTVALPAAPAGTASRDTAMQTDSSHAVIRFSHSLSPSHSARRASTGWRLAAFTAGYKPKITPSSTEKPKAQAVIQAAGRWSF